MERIVAHAGSEHLRREGYRVTLLLFVPVP